MEAVVISIGALPSHPLRGEQGARRTGHATTTLIVAPPMHILVDPGLPGPAIAARLDERAGITPEQVTHVFLTRFTPDTARGVKAFDGATWWTSQDEREAVGIGLAEQLRRLVIDDDPETLDIRARLEHDVAVLQRCEPAPDRLTGKRAERVDLFPLPGVSPGTAGLLLPLPGQTLLVCGDAVLTREHFERGRVPDDCFDVASAQESFKEAAEIADILVPGRDNLIVNRMRQRL